MDRMPRAGIRELFMRCLTILLVAIAASFASAQQQDTSSHAGSGATTFSDSSNLPVGKLGRDDLIGITVYDSPELTRTVRVDSEGNIRLPMVQQHIKAAGLYPSELEKAVTTVLVEENVLVDPIVTVSVVEYRSRPITVVGAVRNPVTFQATGNVTLLDAISRAGGVTESAGSEILVSHSQSNSTDNSVALTERVHVRDLLSVESSSSNLSLDAGDNIRVLEAGRVFVAGNVKKPGMFTITEGSETSVLRAIAISDGLNSFSRNLAYIYRTTETSGHRDEIVIDLKKILARKSPDVPLYPNDLLYIPTATGQQVSMKALETAVGVGIGIATLMVYATR